MQKNGGNLLIEIDLVLEKAKISNGFKLADFGCGASGFFLFAASRIIGKNGTVYGVDILKNVLENINHRARQDNINNVKTVWSDIEVYNSTKIEPNSLDAVLLVNTLYLSQKRADVIREAMRLIKKGGRIVVVDWNNTSSPFGPSIEQRVKEELLKEGAKKLGLNIEDEFIAGKYHYGLIFNKI
jgi:arsenite methyltransferase